MWGCCHSAWRTMALSVRARDSDTAVRVLSDWTAAASASVSAMRLQWASEPRTPSAESPAFGVIAEPWLLPCQWSISARAGILAPCEHRTGSGPARPGHTGLRDHRPIFIVLSGHPPCLGFSVPTTLLWETWATLLALGIVMPAPAEGLGRQGDPGRWGLRGLCLQQWICHGAGDATGPQGHSV